MSTLARDFPEYDAMEREELRAQDKWARRHGQASGEEAPVRPAQPVKTITYAEIQRRNGITKGAV